jgi:hypothetical protein
MGDLDFLSNIPLGNEEIEVEFRPRVSASNKKFKASRHSTDEESSPEKTSKRKKNRGRALEVVEEASSSTSASSSDSGSDEDDDDDFLASGTPLARSAVIPRSSTSVDRRKIASSDPSDTEGKKDKKKKKLKFVCTARLTLLFST